MTINFPSRATPFLHAAVAAALDCEVEIHFSGRSTRLLVMGEAEQLFPLTDGSRSIYAFMCDATEFGVRLVACTMALHSYVKQGELFIPEYSGNASVTDFVLRTLDPEWATLIF